VEQLLLDLKKIVPARRKHICEDLDFNGGSIKTNKSNAQSI
jgi:hypothetical protein